MRDELEGVHAGERAPSEAGPANEPWQEQHWCERLPQSPEGAPGEWEEQGTTARRQHYWYNRKTGEASPGRPDAAAACWGRGRAISRRWATYSGVSPIRVGGRGRPPALSVPLFSKAEVAGPLRALAS